MARDPAGNRSAERRLHDDGLIGRRTYLKAGAAAVSLTLGSAAVAGAAIERHGISFDRTVDLVADFGADPTGGVSIDSALRKAVQTGTLVVLPEGTYKLTSTFTTSAERFGIVGDGDVTLVPTGFRGKFIDLWQSDEFLFEGIDVDVRNNRNTGLKVYCRTKFHVENVEYLGRGGRSGQAFNLGLHDERGVGVLRNARVKNGGYMDLYDGGDGRIGIWSGWANKGTLRVLDCDFREFGNNGLYTGRTPGNIQVEGCYFENNNVSSVRISGRGAG
ncbi:hypothetical protein C2R22_14760 [Salinigranum rubrum]|uniref:Uncharacterized protein n=1 Tax=Salinigranum rubrum TaxID=755307 RepID=A0A2I8VLF6_9EURY|nr:glycosyl hydrolase family 28-related protein [Salinigranum rubrum]AUV82748.1 hypothetical protein C2R22_14760 [Salinigranum rubrum]